MTEDTRVALAPEDGAGLTTVDAVKRAVFGDASESGFDDRLAECVQAASDAMDGPVSDFGGCFRAWTLEDVWTWPSATTVPAPSSVRLLRKPVTDVVRVTTILGNATSQRSGWIKRLGYGPADSHVVIPVTAAWQADQLIVRYVTGMDPIPRTVAMAATMLAAALFQHGSAVLDPGDGRGVGNPIFRRLLGPWIV